MTSSVTAPLERQFGQMPGLNQMSSQSSAGRVGDHPAVRPRSQPRHRRAGGAGGDQRGRQSAAGRPAGAADLRQGQSGRRADPDAGGDVEDPAADQGGGSGRHAAGQKISQLPGVGLVSISGGQRPAVRVQANVRALAAYGLNIDDLRTTIGNANVNTPKGNFDGPTQASTINANDQLADAADYRGCDRRLPQRRAGAAVRRRQRGRRGREQQARRLDEHHAGGHPERPAPARRQRHRHGRHASRRCCRSCRRRCRRRVNVTPLTDRTTTIRASVADVEFELALAVALVVLVIFLFLRNLPATIIPSLSVPLSLVGTLAVMYLWGFSPRQSVADGADHRHRLRRRRRHRHDREHRPLRRAGRARRSQAALKGSEQIGFTIISLTVSLIAVLIPLLFMGDVVGRLFHEFAITLAVTIVISAVVSLTLVPMLCAKLLRHRDDRRGRAPRARPRAHVRRADRPLRPGARLGARPPAAHLLVAVGTLVLTVVLYVVIPKGFFPGAGHRPDPGHLAGRADDLLCRDGRAPAGAGRGHPEGSGRRQPVLVHRRRRHQHDAEQRPLPDQSEAARRAQPRAPARSSAGCRRETAGVAGVTLYLQPVQDLTIDTTVSRTQYQFVLENPDPDRVRRLGAEAARRGSASRRSIADVASDNQQDGLAAYHHDRPRHGRPLRHHAGDRRQRALRRVRPAHHLDHLHPVEPVPRHPRGRSDAAAVAALAELDLSALVDRRGSVEPRARPGAAVGDRHGDRATGRRCRSAISASFRPPRSRSTSRRAPRSARRCGPSSRRRPRSACRAASSPASRARRWRSSRRSATSCCWCWRRSRPIYIVLGVLYESFIHPITILSTLPSAGVGALAGADDRRRRPRRHLASSASCC